MFYSMRMRVLDYVGDDHKLLPFAKTKLTVSRKQTLKPTIKASDPSRFLFRRTASKGSNLLWVVLMVKLFMGNEG